MADREQFGWHRYVAKAFTWQWNVLVFGGAVVAALLSGAPDIALALVAAAETTYLASMTASPKFRKSVDAAHHEALQEERVERKAATRLEDAIHALYPDRQRRFKILRDRCVQMKHLAAGVRGETNTHGALHMQALDRMLWTFLRLLASEQALYRFLETTDEKSMKARVADINRRMKSARTEGDEKILRALVDSSATAQLRLDNLEKARQNARFVEVELDRIEDKIQALVEMAVSHEDPDFLSGEVDFVAASISDTEAVMREMSFVPGVEQLDDTAPAILSQPEYS